MEDMVATPDGQWWLNERLAVEKAFCGCYHEIVVDAGDASACKNVRPNEYPVYLVVIVPDRFEIVPKCLHRTT